MRAGGLGLGVGRARGRIRGGASVPVAPTLTWDTPSSVNTPTFTAALTSPAVSDVVTFQIDTLSDFSSAPASTPDTVDAGEATASQVTFTLTTLADGTYYVRAKVTRAGVDSAWSPTVVVTIATVPAEFFTDTFTAADGTLLTAHTSDSGHTWSLQPGNSAPTTAPTIQSNRLYPPSSGNVYRASVTPPSADYKVEAVLDRIAAHNGESFGIAGRMQEAANDFYFVFWSAATANWRLFRNNSGTPVQIGSAYADTFSPGASRTVTLRMQGSSLEVLIDGVSRITGTDGNLTAAGHPGVRIANATLSTNGIHMNAMTATAL